MGPVGSYREVEELLSRRRPTFALVDADLGQELQPVSELLDEHDVPFALLAIGAANQMLDRHSRLNNCLRIHRPYHCPALHAAARSLYEDSLTRRSSRQTVTWRRESTSRASDRADRTAGGGRYDTSTADALAREYGRALKAMRAGRNLFAQRLESFSGHATQATPVAVHEPFTGDPEESAATPPTSLTGSPADGTKEGSSTGKLIQISRLASTASRATSSALSSARAGAILTRLQVFT